MATETQNNVPLLHKKMWQTLDPVDAATAAGSMVIADPLGLNNIALYIVSNTVHYLYHHDEEMFAPITSGAFAVAIAAGACGAYHPWSKNFAANGGSTTTVTVAAATHNLNGFVNGCTIEFLTGTAGNIGLRRTITNILTNAGTGNITLYLDSAVTSSVANADTFRVASGSFFVLNAGTLVATNYHKRFDLATLTWTDLAITGLPATWGTDGKMVIPYCLNEAYDSGTATSGSATTLVNSARAWATDQWKNHQARITAGTGMGQVKVITSNDGTTLTIGSGATLDATSQYVIEGDENAIYYLGNNAVTLYKYSISGNSTSTVTPAVARSGAPVAGMTANFVGVTGEYGWALQTDIKNGRYIYSIRGGVATIDRYDIATQGWAVVNYVSPVTFATGTSAFWHGRYLYIAKEGTAAIPQRIYKYSLRGNYIEPVAVDWYLGGVALLGSKMWCKHLSTQGNVWWIYILQSSTTTLRRLMVY